MGYKNAIRLLKRVLCYIPIEVQELKDDIEEEIKSFEGRKDVF